MNLPTREEAKNIAIELVELAKEKDLTMESRQALYNANTIVNQYSSGSLIEARTEGEIEEILNEVEKDYCNFCEHKYSKTNCALAQVKNNCSIDSIDNKKRANVLIGKV